MAWVLNGSYRCTVTFKKSQGVAYLSSKTFESGHRMQVLSLSNTSVIAAARPTDDFERLSSLQRYFDTRLMIVEMELLDPSTVEESKDSIAERSSPTKSSHYTSTSCCMQAAAKLVQDAHPQGIDYLINNAGILGSYSDVVQQ